MSLAGLSEIWDLPFGMVIMRMADTATDEEFGLEESSEFEDDLPEPAAENEDSIAEERPAEGDDDVVWATFELTASTQGTEKPPEDLEAAVKQWFEGVKKNPKLILKRGFATVNKSDLPEIRTIPAVTTMVSEVGKKYHRWHWHISWSFIWPKPATGRPIAIQVDIPEFQKSFTKAVNDAGYSADGWHFNVKHIKNKDRPAWARSAIYSGAIAAARRPGVGIPRSGGIKKTAPAQQKKKIVKDPGNGGSSGGWNRF